MNRVTIEIDIEGEKAKDDGPLVCTIDLDTETAMEDFDDLCMQVKMFLLKRKK